MTDSASNPIIALAAAAAGLGLVWFFAPRALLFLSAGTVRVDPEEPADVVTVPGALEATWAALQALGFTLLGSHSEKPRLGRAALFYDALQAEAGVYASLSVSPRGAAHLTLFTPGPGGGAVTASFRRPAREVPGRYLAGAIDGATPERLYKVHLRRLADLRERSPLAPTLEGRVQAGRTWYAEQGASELRASNTIALLWTCGGLALTVAALLKV